ncbi:MAG: hypothetical protein COB08_014705 [Rhodobacteraceae bacterium]|nr:hypothetical protein [Paracoccaceae bacterium]
MNRSLFTATIAAFTSLPLLAHAEIYSCSYNPQFNPPIIIDYDTTTQRFALVDFVGSSTLSPETVVSEFSAVGGQLHFNFDEYYDGYVESRLEFSFDFDKQEFWQTTYLFNADGTVQGQMSISEQGTCVAGGGQAPASPPAVRAASSITADICAYDGMQTSAFMSRTKCVSSVLSQVGEYTFRPESLFYSENIFAHAWCEGAAGNGVGEKISLNYEDDNPSSFGSLMIANGFTADSRSFSSFSRVKRIRVEVDSGQSWEFDLADTPEPQELAFRGHIISNNIYITILDVYPGALYDDACISDIDVMFEGF